MKFVFGLRNIRQRVTGLYGSSASLSGSYLLPVSRSPDIFRGTSEFAVELRLRWASHYQASSVLIRIRVAAGHTPQWGQMTRIIFEAAAERAHGAPVGKL